MADLVITPADVVPGQGATKLVGTAGATITAGKVVYRDPADSKFKLADSNGASEVIRSPAGIALTGSSDGQPIVVHTAGPITIGATVTAGVGYFLSDTPGGICPFADVGTGEEVTQLGLASSTTVLDIDIQETEVTN